MGADFCEISLAVSSKLLAGNYTASCYFFKTSLMISPKLLTGNYTASC
jgi:hypothetical protein